MKDFDPEFIGNLEVGDLDNLIYGEFKRKTMIRTKTKRSRPIQVMLNEKEYKIICDICTNLNISKADYLRSLFLNSELYKKESDV